MPRVSRMKILTRARWTSWSAIVFVTVLTACLTACDEPSVRSTEEPPPETPEHPLVGRWVRVYPPAGGRDTIRLYPSGQASGPASAVSAGEPFEFMSRWVLGGEFDPNALCFGESGYSLCVGYLLRGDTLALADGDSTVLIRASAVNLDLEAEQSGRIVRAMFGEVPRAPSPP